MSPLLAFAPFGFELPLPIILLGLVTGATYGLLSAGLVLVYRTSRVINFAHGEIGVFGATVFAIAVRRWHVPYYLALPIGLAAGAAAAMLTEAAVVRRLRAAPRLMSIVATLGAGQFLLFFTAAINPSSSAGSLFPSPPGLPEFHFGPVRMSQAYVGMLVLGPTVIVALAMFLRYSRYGLAIRCASSNSDAARMAGIWVSRTSAMAWGIAGGLSALTALLVLPASGFNTGDSFGPSLLVRALAGAVLARMTNLPVALASGLGIGVLERLLSWNYPGIVIVEPVVYVVILGVLLFRRGATSSREEEKGSWTAVQGWAPLPETVARLREMRVLPWVVAGVSLAAAASVPLWASHSTSSTLSTIFCFAMVGLSLGIVTGLGGQLSLGQFGIAGVGAVVSHHVASHGGSFPLAFLYGGLAAAALSLAIGLPALRLKGVMLTVTTLGFAVVAESWLLRQSWALGTSVRSERPTVLGNELDNGREYYLFVLALLVVVMILCRNVRRGGLGRRLRAVRDNEDGARAFTVPAAAVKLQGFVLAGFVAGIGGAAFGHMLARLGPDAFAVRSSVDVAAMTVLGGMSLLAGPLIGAFYIIGVPKFLPLDSAGFAATQLGWLVLILYLPRGISQLIEPLRRAYAAWAARRHGINLLEAELLPAESGPEVGDLPVWVRETAAGRAMRNPVLLRAVDLRKSFGGVAAVGGVDIDVRAGEIVGLIGPNGAGKTTTFELLGGFTRHESGKVLFNGEDVSDLAPEERAARGLIRSFQDAALFPTMTVLEAVQLAFERVAPTSFVASLAGLHGAERAKERKARELIGAMGLSGYRYKQIQELSTGTRRIVEIACLIALQPTLLLLDEPSSGVAQRETEALGRLLGRIREDLDLTMLIIEHDIPLIMGLSDRIVAMESGKVIVVGTPEVVRNDPRVVEAYLGSNTTAIERSDTAGSDGKPAAGGTRTRTRTRKAVAQPAAASTNGSRSKTKVD